MLRCPTVTCALASMTTSETKAWMHTRVGALASVLHYDDATRLHSEHDRYGFFAGEKPQADCSLPQGSTRSLCVGSSSLDSLRRHCALCEDKRHGLSPRWARADVQPRSWHWSLEHRILRSVSWETYRTSGSTFGSILTEKQRKRVTRSCDLARQRVVPANRGQCWHRVKGPLTQISTP